MTHLHRWPLLATFVATTAIFVACAGGKPIDVGDDDDDGATSPLPINTTFAAGAVPAMSAAGCIVGGCHIGPTGTSGLALGGGGMTNPQIYQELITPPASTVIVINTANAAASTLLVKGEGGAGHGGGAKWASSDNNYQSVLGWIQSGAPEN